MAEPLSPTIPTQNSANPLAERQATTNIAAFCHWLRAVDGLQFFGADSTGDLRCPQPLAALRAWAEADPPTAAELIRRFAGTKGESARIAGGLLLQADLRPDDIVLVAIRGRVPDWLPQALAVTQGRTTLSEAATVLIADHLPEILPPKIRRIILTEQALISGRSRRGSPSVTPPTGVTRANRAPTEECERPPCGPRPRPGASG